MAYKLDSVARYAETDEWVRIEGSIAVVGITDYAQDKLSDVVFVELPAVGTRIQQGKPMATVESVKAASDIHAPLSGVVTEINDALGDSPELVNADPYGAAWFFKMEPDDKNELNQLMSADDYDAFCATRE